MTRKAIQAAISYDWTGDGNWDRTEIFKFFATNPTVGYEEYKTSVVVSTSGAEYQALKGGSVRIQLWAALPDGGNQFSIQVINVVGTSGPIYVRGDSIISGQLSTISIPFQVSQWAEPVGCSTCC